MNSWRTRQTETVHPSQLPDSLLELTVAGRAEAALVLMEVGTKPERRMVRQLQRGMQLVHLETGELPEVVAVILQPHGRYRVPRTVTIDSPLGLTRWQARWHVVELWTLNAEELLALDDVGAIPWVPLTQFDGPPEQLFRECRDRIERQAPENQREQLLAATRIMARLCYNDQGLLSILFGSTSMIKWTDFPDFKEALDKTELETGRRNLAIFLKGRYPRVPKGLLRKMETIDDPKRISELITLVATSPDLETFRAHLTL